MRARTGGFTLVEVMIAMVTIVMLAMTLAACLGAACAADSASRDKMRSAFACQQAMEEMLSLDWGDTLAQDGTAILTSEGVAVKVSAQLASPGLILIEVYAFRPQTPLTLSSLGAMSMTQAKALPAMQGSQVRVLTYYACLN
jgi:hypothetical protein